MPKNMTERKSPEKWYDFVVKDTEAKYEDTRLGPDTPPPDLKLPHHAKLCAMGLVLPDGEDEEDQLDRNQWFDIGKKLVEIDKGVQFSLGDWWAFGRHKYRDKTNIAKELKYDYGYLCNLGSVARRVPISSRNENVSFKHHTKVVKLSPIVQEEWLARAAEQNWTAETLEQRIKDEKKQNDATENEEFKEKDPEGYRIAQSHKKAGDAIYQFEKIAKANHSLEHCIRDIIADPQYLADLDDREIARLIKEATSIVDMLAEPISALEKEQERRVTKGDEPTTEPKVQLEKKRIERERLDEKPGKRRERLDDKPVKRERLKAA